MVISWDLWPFISTLEFVWHLVNGFFKKEISFLATNEYWLVLAPAGVWKKQNK